MVDLEKLMAPVGTKVSLAKQGEYVTTLFYYHWYCFFNTSHSKKRKGIGIW